MNNVYHAGELAVQAKAGVSQEAQFLTRMINPDLQPIAKKFLATQQLAIAASIDRQSRVWASLLTGEPGFIEPISSQIVQIKTNPTSSDPLSENLSHNSRIGILAIDLVNRRRMRLNGWAELLPDNFGMQLHTEQVYFNCPKYIQTRQIEDQSATVSQSIIHNIGQAERLTPKQQDWIANADTFFVSSYDPSSEGADASHRGGMPGFIQVMSDRQLVYPDYAGNNMFNTLGNINANPASGLLFVDFTQGKTLQLTGKSEIIWDQDRIQKFSGAERLVEFTIDAAIEISNATNLRWRFGEYSPFNPTVLAPQANLNQPACDRI